MVQNLLNQISSFSQGEIQELYKNDKYSIWKEYDFYKEIDQCRREILGLFLEIDNAYGNWNFMDRVLPSIFRELYDVFKKTLKIVKENVEEINYELWIKGSWYLPEYRKKQNQESCYFYLLEYLISKFKKEFISIGKLSEEHSKRSYESALKKSKIRIQNAFYYFHHKAINKLKNKAEISFTEKISNNLKNLQLPVLSYSESLLYDLDVKICRDKLDELFEPSYKYNEYELGLEPIWYDDQSNISAFYFDNVKDPLVLITNLDNSKLSQSIRDSGEKELFQQWFDNEQVKEKIVLHYFFGIYLKYLRKKELSQEDIEKSKRKIRQKYVELKEYYGINNTLSELIKILRTIEEKKIEQEAPFLETSFLDEDSGYDPDADVQAHAYYILNSIFPIIPFSWSKNKIEISKDKKEPEEIAIIDLETTGTNVYSDVIVEVGICKLNLKTGEITSLLDTICQEKGKEIDPDAWIFNHSNLDYYDVREAPDLQNFRKEIQHILNKYPITSYRQAFDLNFLRQRGFKVLETYWDPMFKAQYILKIPRYNGDYKWPSFQEAWNYFFPNKNCNDKHRAYTDAYHTAQLIHGIYKLQKGAED